MSSLETACDDLRALCLDYICLACVWHYAVDHLADDKQAQEQHKHGQRHPLPSIVELRIACTADACRISNVDGVSSMRYTHARIHTHVNQCLILGLT